MGEQQQASRVRVWWSRTWPWGLGLERMMWAAGSVVAAVAVVVLMVTGHARLTPGSVFWAVVFVPVVGWGFGRWFQGRDHPPQPLQGWFVTLIAWALIAGVLRAVYRGAVLELAPGGLLQLGGAERVLLIPVAIALLASLGGKLRLHLLVTRLAVFGIAISMAASADGTWPTTQPAGASGPALAAAVKRGGPFVLGGGIPSARPPAAATCQARAIADQRRSLLGLKGRSVSGRFEVCWDDHDDVVFIAATQHFDRHGEIGGFRKLRPADASVFGIGFNGGTSGHPQRPRGLGKLEPDDAILAEVTRLGGREFVNLVAAYELLDPRGPVDTISDGSDSSDGSDGSSNSTAAQWRTFPFDVGRGRAIDLVSAEFDPRGTPEASIVRFSRSGREILADDRGTPGGR